MCRCLGAQVSTNTFNFQWNICGFSLTKTRNMEHTGCVKVDFLLRYKQIGAEGTTGRLLCKISPKKHSLLSSTIQHPVTSLLLYQLLFSHTQSFALFLAHSRDTRYICCLRVFSSGDYTRTRIRSTGFKIEEWYRFYEIILTSRSKCKLALMPELRNYLGAERPKIRVSISGRGKRFVSTLRLQGSTQSPLALVQRS